MDSDAEQRFASLASRMGVLERSVDGLDRRCADIEGALMTNTGLTERTSAAVESTAQAMSRIEGKVDIFHKEMRETLAIIKGSRRFARFVKWLMRALNRVARWSVPLLIAGSALWAWLHGGRMPK